VRYLFTLLAACAIVCWALGPSSAEAPPAPSSFVSKTGVRVVVQADNNSDTVALCLFVRAGVAEEEGVAGVGSVTSRALFGSNYQQSGDSVSRAIYDAGGSLESRFTPDYTVFTCVTTKDRFRDAVYLLATALKSAEFDSEALRRAKADVAADIARELRDPFPAGYAKLRDQLYADSPYRLPNGGTDEALRTVTPEAVKRFFTRRYTPENTVLSVVGNITAELVERTVANQFVDFERAPGRPLRLASDEYAPPSRSERAMPTTTTLLLAGYRAPAVGNHDYPAALVLEAMLGGGKSSRLFRQVRDVAGVGYAVGTTFPTLARPSHLVAYVEYNPARDANTTVSQPNPEKLLVDTVRTFITNPPTPEEVERAKRFAAGTHALNHQRTRDRAFYLGLYETLGVGYGFDAELSKRIDAVTPQDVARVAKNCLTEPAIVIVHPPAREQFQAGE
jgi:zinc protease